ncbi:hypothetical protein CF327_g4299 [Tilletia walkeri]|uniref:RRM domain-containing protein n=1 Tax=Tilletia walkeri TaxID=117179 RepID=A0A8X7N9E8_9BASI|nr:hypothetical protein CF327_g4299 [Tilletia walkeri]KAE8269617.1 hypothetical protein A4X09_0g2726 [Tilletia walkeri]
MDNLNASYQSLNMGHNNNQQQQQGSDQHSAAARFERFFNSSAIGDPSSPSSPTSPTSSKQQQQQQQSSTMSAATGSAASHSLSANGAFASFHLSPHLHNQQRPGSAATVGPGSGPSLRSQSSRSALPQGWSNNGGGGGAGAGAPSSGAGGTDTPINPDDDIIPNAIVVKNIRFDVKREQLLSIMEELSLPIPYAFNYHFDQGVFRGLAFANFRTAEDADQVVAALNGFDVMGRKLRVEYKKVLQAGEKERIEKEKAIKRMQSMQMDKERRRMQDEYAMAAAGMGMGMGMPPPQQPGFGGVAPPLPPLPTFHTDVAPPQGGQQQWDPSSPYGLAYPSDAQSATSPTLSSASGVGNGAGAPVSLGATVRSTYTADAFRSVPHSISDQGGQQPVTSPSTENKIGGGAGFGAGGAQIGTATTTTTSSMSGAASPSLSAASTSGANNNSQLGSSAPPSNANNGSSAAPAPSSKRGEELDLNDPATLEIYSRVLLFRDDRMRDELSFSRNLSPLERRTVHLVAQKLDLYHYSMGEGEERYVIVTKNEVAQPSRSLRTQASTIGRSNRDAYAAAMSGNNASSNSNNNNGMLYPHATTGRAGAQALLRMKKSAPDMKRYENLGVGAIGSGYGSGGANGSGFVAPPLPGGGSAGARGGWGAVGSNSSFQRGMGGGAGQGGPSSSSLMGNGASNGGGGGGMLGSDLFGNGGLPLGGRRSNVNLREGYAATMGRQHYQGGGSASPGGMGGSGHLGGGGGGGAGLPFGTVSGSSSSGGGNGEFGSNRAGASGLQNLFSSPFDVPPVPTLSSGSVTMDPPMREREGSTSGVGNSNAVRQPRGPPTPGTGEGGGSRGNFAVRSRVSVPSRGGGGQGQGSQGELMQDGRAGQGQQGGGGGGMGDVDAQTHSPLEI